MNRPPLTKGGSPEDLEPVIPGIMETRNSVSKDLESGLEGQR